MKPFTLLLIYATWITLMGCDQTRQNAEPKPSAVTKSVDRSTGDKLPADVFPTEASTNTVMLNGWTISYPRSYKQIGMTMTDGILRIEFEKFTFQVRDNLISVDNRTYGAAKKGDVVLIGLNGEIAVNGTVREPSAE